MSAIQPQVPVNRMVDGGRAMAFVGLLAVLTAAGLYIARKNYGMSLQGVVPLTVGSGGAILLLSGACTWRVARTDQARNVATQQAAGTAHTEALRQARQETADARATIEELRLQLTATVPPGTPSSGQQAAAPDGQAGAGAASSPAKKIPPPIPSRPPLSRSGSRPGTPGLPASAGAGAAPSTPSAAAGAGAASTQSAGAGAAGAASAQASAAGAGAASAAPSSGAAEIGAAAIAVQQPEAGVWQPARTAEEYLVQAREATVETLRLMDQAVWFPIVTQRPPIDSMLMPMVLEYTKLTQPLPDSAALDQRAVAIRAAILKTLQDADVSTPALARPALAIMEDWVVLPRIRPLQTMRSQLPASGRWIEIAERLDAFITVMVNMNTTIRKKRPLADFTVPMARSVSELRQVLQAPFPTDTQEGARYEQHRTALVAYMTTKINTPLETTTLTPSRAGTLQNWVVNPRAKHFRTLLSTINTHHPTGQKGR
jgi:hypothetical protein